MRRFCRFGRLVLPAVVLIGAADRSFALDPQKSIASTSATPGDRRTACRRTPSPASPSPTTATSGSAPRDGLARFDGVRFTVFNRLNTPAMRSNVITSLRKGRDGSIWAGTDDGLIRYKDGRFVDLHRGRRAAAATTSTSARGRSPAAWSGWEPAPASSASIDGDETAIRSRRRTCRAGAARQRLARFARRPLVQPRAHDVSSAPPDRRPAGAARRAAGPEHQRALRRPPRHAVARGHRRRLQAGRRRLRLFAPTADAGPRGAGRRRRRAVGRARRRRPRPAPQRRLAVLHRRRRADRRHRPAAVRGSGTHDLGRHRAAAASTAFRSASSPPTAWPRGWRATSRTRCCRTAAATSGSRTPQGLTRFGADGERRILRCRRRPVGFAHPGAGRVRRMAACWSAPSAGSIASATAASPWSPIDPPLPSTSVRGIVEDRNGTLWVATLSGLFRVDAGKAIDRPGHQRRQRRCRWRSIATATCCSACATAGLMRYHDGAFTLADHEGRAVAQHRHRDLSGRRRTLWLGTNGGGLNRLKDGKITAVREQDGLLDDTIYAIIEDAAGTDLWMGSNRGVWRVSKAEHRRVRAPGDQPGSTRSPTAPATACGRPPWSATAASSPSVWRAHDGRLWFPTIKGLVAIDPATIRDQRDAAAGGDRIAAVGPRRGRTRAQPIGPGYRNLEFQYTALSFVAPRELSFRYKLEGFDPDWIDAGDAPHGLLHQPAARKLHVPRQRRQQRRRLERGRRDDADRRCRRTSTTPGGSTACAGSAPSPCWPAAIGRGCASARAAGQLEALVDERTQRAASAPRKPPKRPAGPRASSSPT